MKLVSVCLVVVLLATAECLLEKCWVYNQECKPTSTSDLRFQVSSKSGIPVHMNMILRKHQEEGCKGGYRDQVFHSLITDCERNPEGDKNGLLYYKCMERTASVWVKETYAAESDYSRCDKEVKRKYIDVMRNCTDGSVPPWANLRHHIKETPSVASWGMNAKGQAHFRSTDMERESCEWLEEIGGYWSPRNVLIAIVVLAVLAVGAVVGLFVAVHFMRRRSVKQPKSLQSLSGQLPAETTVREQLVDLEA